ncbi:MAG: AI-2E family transporter [Actinomycetes bacterium]
MPDPGRRPGDDNQPSHEPTAEPPAEPAGDPVTRGAAPGHEPPEHDGASEQGDGAAEHDDATAEHHEGPHEHHGEPHEEEPHLPFGEPGHPLRNSPFIIGFTGALGVLLAIGLTRALSSSRQVLVLIVVSMFLAVGLNPAVEALTRRGMRRGYAVLCVFVGLLLIFVGFGAAIAPPLAEQSGAFVTNVPEYLDRLQGNRRIRDLDQEYEVIDRLREYVSSGSLAEQAFGGIVGVGKVVLGAAFSALTVLILTLYFLGSLPAIKRACYELVPATRRHRVQRLGDEILERVGGYVSGALLVATCAGISSYVFLQIVGLRDFALALALLVALFDLIPLIGATIGAVVVTLVGFLESFPVGVACLVFYIAYQQVENYLVYPRVMRRSVDVPPALTVVAALLGGTLLGVVGALLAIPIAAAALLIVREVVVPRQERT